MLFHTYFGIGNTGAAAGTIRHTGTASGALRRTDTAAGAGTVAY